jgi:hypothetical protein
LQLAREAFLELSTLLSVWMTDKSVSLTSRAERLCKNLFVLAMETFVRFESGEGASTHLLGEHSFMKVVADPVKELEYF